MQFVIKRATSNFLSKTPRNDSVWGSQRLSHVSICGNYILFADNFSQKIIISYASLNGGVKELRDYSVGSWKEAIH